MPAPRVSRRHIFGYTGAAALGGTAGLVGGRMLAPQAETGPEVVQQSYAAHGAHQAGILTMPQAVGELVAFDLLPVTDRAALGRLMRVWSSTIAALTAGRPAPGDATPDLAQAGVSMTVLIGFGPGVFDLPGLESRRPEGFQEIPAMQHDALEDRWSGGDLLAWVSADDATSVAYATRRLKVDATPFAVPRWTQRGSWRSAGPDGRPVTGRNLFGQVDGTANPAGEARDAAVFSSDGWLTGGTQLVVRRIRMDLDTWDSLTRNRQEQSLGRTLDTGAPLTGGDEHTPMDLSATVDGKPVIAVDAHARLAHPSQNSGRTMVRRGLNYTHEEWIDGEQVSTAGLIFSAFQASIADQFIPVQRTLDQSDALNEWTTAIGSAVFAVPPGFADDGWLGEGLLAD